MSKAILLFTYVYHPLVRYRRILAPLLRAKAYRNDDLYLIELVSRAPLIKSIIFLRELKGIVARRKVKLMALVLNKLCNAANVPFRSRPKGLTGLLVLSVIIFHQVPTCFQNNALITSKSVSQKHYRLNQRYPGG